MLATTQGTFVLAEGIENTTKTEENGGSVEPGIEEQTTTEPEEEKEEGEDETTTTVKSEDETGSSDEETSSNESTTVDESSSESVKESTDESKDESTSENESTSETTSTEILTETTKKYIADEEDTATVSDAENEDDSNEKETTKNFGLFGDANESTLSEASLLPEPKIEKKFGNIDIDYVAPIADEGSGLFGADPTELPSRWDSREHTNTTTGLNYVSPIRFQNPYGICWAFATACMFETSIRKKGLATTNEEANLSELALAYFMYNLKDVTKNPDSAGKPGLEGDDYTIVQEQYYINKGEPENAVWYDCGGNQFFSTKMLTAYVGMVVEDNKTEFSGNGNKTQAMIDAEDHGLPAEYAFGKNAYIAKDIRYINKNNRDAIKKAIMDNGSVGFSYYAEWEAYNGKSPDDFAFHWDDDGSYYHSRNRTGTNHAVAIIGWDDNIPKEKFYFGGQGAQSYPDHSIMQWVYTNPPTQEEYDGVTTTGYKSTGNGAWLVRNSWSDSPYYLKGGYFYIPYDEPSLSETFFSVDAISGDTYKYNYHYDTTAYSSSTASYSFGNIYKVSGEDDSQIIEAVNVGIDETNMEFDIKIYTSDDEMDNPTDGNLAATKRCSNELAGFYTYELDTPVSVSKDTYFSVVFESVNDSTTLVFCDNIYTPTTAFYNTYNEIKAKQSFRKSFYGSWQDLCSESPRTIGDKVYGKSMRLKALGNSGISVRFDSNGGEGTMTSQAMVSGVPANLKKNTFKKSGYRFKNWKDLDTGIEYEDCDEITIVGPVTLTAQWEEARYTLQRNWYDEAASGMTEQDITSIKIQMYPTASPSSVDAAWDIPNSDGLIASRKGTNVFIYAPDTSITGKIDLPEDSNHLFSKQDSVYPDGADWDHVFSHCETLDGLDLLDTSNVTNMRRMFAGLGNLNMYDNTMMNLLPNPKEITLDVSTFDTSNVTDMSLMFEQAAIKNINIGNFNTRKLTDTRWMFAQCGILQNIDLSRFGTATISNASGMFELCMSMSSINLDGATFENTTSMSSMFSGCESLTTLDLSSFNTAKVTDMKWMFKNCSSLTTITVSKKFKTDLVTNSEDMFLGCSVLQGGAGTTYSNSNPNDKTYAVVDGKGGLPGYFTSAASVTVTFDYDGKGTNYSETYEKGETINRPTDPTYDGYNFVHWYKEGTSDTIPFVFTNPISQDSAATIRLIAKWTAKTYTINYSVGAGATVSPTSFTKTYGTPYTGSLATPTKDGWTFEGWYKESTYDNLYDKTTDDIYVEGKTSPYYIYAKWTAKTYTINYIAGTGATVSPTSFTKTYGTPITSDLAVPTKTGYTFVNWYKESTFDNVYDKSTDDIYVEGGTQPYNIYAKFDANEYTVDYDLVGVAATKPATITKEYDTPLTAGDLQNPTGIPAGYEFVGWFRSYDSSTGTYGTEWTGSDDLTSTTDTQIIYAKWKRAIVYNVLKDGITDIGATAVASKEITGETTYNLPGTSATGYTFGGWYREAACTNFVGNEGNPVTVSAPTTFYAKWTPIEYKIYYKNIEGSSIAADTYVTKTYGTTVTLDTAPTKTGYVFSGWFTDNTTFANSYDGTTDITPVNTNDKYIYANWTANQYQVNYNLSGISATAPSTPVTKTYGEALAAGTLKNPTNIPNGYTFAGWYKESSFVNEWTGNDDLTDGTNAQTIYARWKAKITYNANGHGTTPAAVDVFLNTTTELPSISNVTGYTFDTTNSWYDGADASTATLIGAAGSDYTVTVPKELFAHWIEDEYTITYDRKDGNWTGTAPAGTRKYSEEVILPVAADIAKNDGANDYVFKGWYTEDGSSTSWDETKKVTKIDANTVAPAGGHKFYARWNPAWKITFNMLSHGTAPSEITVEQGTVVPSADRPAAPTETGYVFSGWYRTYNAGAATFDEKYSDPFNFATDTVTANTLLYAKWKPVTYTIRYNANGGSVTPTTDTKTYAENLTLAIPARDGYDFDAWYQNYDSSTKTFTNEYDGTTDISTTQGDTKDVYAKWTPHQYTVNYDLNGVAATAPATPITKTYGEALAAGVLQNPTNIPSGYEFLGWYKEQATTNQWTGSDDLTTGTDPQTIYAKWKMGIVYNVLKDGTTDIGATAVPVKEITGETTYNLPTTSATGYIFGGWYREAACTNPVPDPVTVSAPTTFYAKWTPIEYKIYYKNIEGSSIADGEYVTKTYDANVTLNTSPTKDGYDFGGWFTDNTTFANGYDGTTDISTEQDVDKNIYAKWDPHTYNINYELGGHATAMAPKEKTYGVSYTPPTPTGIATGYVFDGWFKESTYTTAYTGDDLTTGNTDQTIYARWKAKVTYYANGHGTIPAPATVEVVLGGQTTLKTLDNVTGWTFDLIYSWYDGADITTATLIGAANTPYTVNAPKDLYARWNENEYTITYVKEADASWVAPFEPVSAGATSRKYTEEQILPVAANITRTGYTFLGWYKQGDTSQTVISKINANTDESVTVVAKWSENTYNITLNRNGGSYVSGYSEPSTRKYTESKTLPTNDDIKKTGHTLVGWFESSDYSGTAVTSVAANTNEHKTYYAKWAPETYVVTLNKDGGTVTPASEDVTSYTYGVGATLPTNVTKANSVFKGWWTEDGTTTWGTKVTAISATDTGAKTYYARWASSYTVTFDLLSGTTHPAALANITNVPDSQNVEDGGVAVRPSVNPQAENFEFVDWYTDDTFTTAYNFSTAVTGTTTIYGKWNSVATYEVTFNLMSGTTHPAAVTDITGAPAAQHIVNGRTVTKPTDPTSTGYRFVNWYTDDTFATVWNFTSDTITEPKIIYGKWEEVSYAITYYENGGTYIDGYTKPTSRLYTESKTLPISAEISKHAYTFGGWYESSTYEGTAITSVAERTARDVTIYAKWSPVVGAKIITFYDNYSGATAEQGFIVGEDAAIRTDVFTRSGYTFIRWKDISGNVYMNTNQLTGDIALYADWQENPKPAPYNPGNTDSGSSSSSSSGGRSASGPIPQNQPTQQTVTQGAAPQVQVSTSKSEQIVVNGNTSQWQYDPTSNSWKLSALDLMGVPTVAANGFYILSQIVVELVNNIAVPKTVQDTYYFDSKGDMVTGWVQTPDNKWYFFNNEKTLDEGKLCIGWRKIDGAWYFFSSNDGSMLTNTTTSDGYKVGADGKWIQ